MIWLIIAIVLTVLICVTARPLAKLCYHGEYWEEWIFADTKEERRIYRFDFDRLWFIIKHAGWALLMELAVLAIVVACMTPSRAFNSENYKLVETYPITELSDNTYIKFTTSKFLTLSEDYCNFKIIKYKDGLQYNEDNKVVSDSHLIIKSAPDNEFRYEYWESRKTKCNFWTLKGLFSGGSKDVLYVPKNTVIDK